MKLLYFPQHDVLLSLINPLWPSPSAGRGCVFPGLSSAAQHPHLPDRVGFYSPAAVFTRGPSLWWESFSATGASQRIQSLHAEPLRFICHRLVSVGWGWEISQIPFSFLDYFTEFYIFIFSFVGDVWIFSIYPPNYDPTAADGLYCDKTLYTFALWNAVFETFGIGVLLVRPLKGLLCFVNMSPAPRDADFYGRVWGENVTDHMWGYFSNT